MADSPNATRRKPKPYRCPDGSRDPLFHRLGCGWVGPGFRRDCGWMMMLFGGNLGGAAMPSALEEKDAIREVLAEYCFRLDGGDYDGMAALFAENGTWDTAFGKATGRPGIAGLAREIRARAGDNRPRPIHLVTNIAIALDGDTATVRSNWTVVPDSPSGPK